MGCMAAKWSRLLAPVFAHSSVHLTKPQQLAHTIISEESGTPFALDMLTSRTYIRILSVSIAIGWASYSCSRAACHG